jgi:DnaA family protein
MCLALQPLGEDETRAALRREADRRGILLPDEVMDYMLTRQSATWCT